MTHDPTLADVQRLEDTARRDPAAALATARGWLAGAGDGWDPVLRQRVRLVRADGLARNGQVETSVLVMREINAWAVDHDVPWLQARSHRLLSARFRRAGDGARALEHAVAAVDLLPDDARPVERAHHLLGLADALGEMGSFEQSLRRYDEAAVIAEASGNIDILMHVLNNLAYTHFGAGHADEALRAVERLQALAAQHDLALDVYDLDTIARVYLMLERHQEAVDVLLPVVGSTAPPTRAPMYDGLATGLLTLTEIQRLAGNIDDAQATLDRAVTICHDHGVTGVGIDAQREQAEIYAALGRFEEAFRTYQAFHVADTEFRAVERESRARTLQAIYEADEARRDSDRFRELSVRDPLTGLRNRRYVDEHLGTQLLRAADAGRPLTLAIVDLDHFKNVNDQRSHHVGDLVLQQIGRLLEQCVADVDGGIAARLGGEEFLVVLPQLEDAEALRLLEELARTIREHDWQPFTDGIPVTASIGVSMAPRDGMDRTPLLACADRRLYVAKHNGRDRVVAADGTGRLQPTG